jgi:predicted RecB family endonuclease
LRVLFCGDRDWKDRAVIYRWMRRVRPTVVIEGEARGADRIAREVADNLGIEVERYPALWKTQGRAAGPIRNRRMLVEGKPDLVLAFHDSLADSKGTKNMVTAAQKAGVPWKVINSRRGMVYAKYDGKK